MRIPINIAVVVALCEQVLTVPCRRWQQRQPISFLLRDVCQALAIKNECVGTDPPTPGRAESGSE